MSTFYDEIPPIEHLSQIDSPHCFREVPTTWSIAVCDVRGSTAAIAKGRYKQVNAVSAAAITALLNLDRQIELPFVFGGDGATVLVPPELREAAEAALRATRRLARETFELDLRVGIIPVGDVIASGQKILVGRLHLSLNYQQALFTGGGLAYAERLLKEESAGERYRLSEDGPIQGDFEGFECRWNKIPSAYDESISLLVTALATDDAQRAALYRDIINEIDTIYGDREHRHPIRLDRLRLNLLPGAFNIEARVRTGRAGLRMLWHIASRTLLGRLAIRFKKGGWGDYPQMLIDATDHEKFDDMLRMTISGTFNQRERLVRYLDNLQEAGEIAYGLHSAPEVLVTCVVFDYFGRQVHFVDGADGGYAFAARAMKARLIEAARSAPTQPRSTAIRVRR